MDESIFKEDMITALNKNLAKKPKIIEDNSIQQFSESMTDKEIENYIKRIRGEKGDRTLKQCLIIPTLHQ